MSRKMKDSGVEWIGKIPGEWKVERLQWHLKEINRINNPIETDYILSLNNKTGVIPYEERDNMGNKAKEDCSQYKIAYPVCRDFTLLWLYKSSILCVQGK